LRDVLSRLPISGKVLFVLGDAATLPDPSTCGRPDLQTHIRRLEDVSMAETWWGGDINAVVFVRSESQKSGDASVLPVLPLWIQHMAIRSWLIFLGWCPGDTEEGVPSLCAWKGPVGYTWVPILCEGGFLAFECAGQFSS